MGSIIKNLSLRIGVNLGEFSKKMSQVTSTIESTLGKAAKLTGVGAAVGIGIKGINALIENNPISLAIDFEQTEIAFSTLFGSAENAKKILGDLTTFAAKTPFEFTELTDATKSLKAFGFAQDAIIPTLTRLGDISAGLKIPLGDLSEIYGKAKTQGTLFAEDINQLTGRGIPIIAEFAKIMGVTEGEVKKLASQGKIGFPQLEQAFINLTAEGSQFGGLMEAQSNSLGGLFSTLKDVITQSLTKIGTGIIKAFDLKNAVRNVIAFGESAASYIEIAVNKMISIVAMLSPVFSAGFDFILTVISTAGSGISAVFGFIGDILGSFGIKSGSIIQTVVNAFNFLTNAVKTVSAGISRSFNLENVITKVSAFGKTASSYIEIAVNKIISFVDMLSPVFSAAFDFILQVVSTAGAGISAGFDFILQVISFAGNGISEVLGFVGGILASFGINSGSVIQFVVDAFNFLTFAVKNIGPILGSVITQIELSVVSAFNDIIFLFTDQVPYALGYMYRNWRDILTDIGNITKTVFSNLIDNIGRFFYLLPDLISGNADFSDVWKPLTDGFESSIKESFQLPERELSALELELGQTIDELNKTMTEDFGKTFKPEVSPVLNTDKLNEQIDKSGIKPPEIPTPTPANQDKKTNETKSFTTPEFGSVDAYKLLIAGRVKTPVNQNKKVEDKIDQTNEILNQKLPAMHPVVFSIP